MSYEDILDLEHPVSQRHPPMSMLSRAAQFNPFAALTGFGDAVAETGRETDMLIDLTDQRLLELNEKLMVLQGQMPQHPSVTVSFFRPDDRKAGGSYQTVTGQVRKIDEFDRVLLIEGERIPIDHIMDLDGEIFGAE